MKIIKIAAVVLVLAGSLYSCEKRVKNTSDLDCENELYFYTPLYTSDGVEEFVLRSEKVFFLQSDRIDFLNDWLFVGFEPHLQVIEMENFINESGFFKTTDESKIYPMYNENEYRFMFVNTKEQKTCSQLKEIIHELEKSPIVGFADLSFRVIGRLGEAVFWSYTYSFEVMVKDKDDLSDLYSLVQETNTLIIRQERDSGLYTIRVNKYSKGNALQMANFFHETGKFVYARPMHIISSLIF